MALVGSSTLSLLPITVPGSTSENMFHVRNLGLRWGSLHLKLTFPVAHAVLHCRKKQKLGAARTTPEKCLNTSVTKHVCLQYGRSRRRTASTPSFCDVHILTSLLVENAVDTLIDFPNTQTFIEHQIKDSREHALLPPPHLPELCQLSEGLQFYLLSPIFLCQPL